MVFLAETIKRRAIDAEQARLPIRLAEAVEIDQKAHDAIAEAMTDRLQARMHHLAKIERRQLGRWLPPRRHGAERLRNREPGPQSVLMEAISGPGAAKPGVPASLNFAE